MILNLDGLTGVVWAQLWQLTLLIPLAIWLVRWTCRGRSHLGYVILLAVLVKCLVPPVWSSPTGVFSWASHAIRSGAVTPVVDEVSNAVAIDAPITRPTEFLDPTSQRTSASISVASVDDEANSEFPDPLPVAPVPAVAPNAAAIDWGQVGIATLVGLWVCGIVGVLGYLLAKRVYLERFHNDTRVATQDELLSIVQECAVALDLRSRPDLVVTTHPTIPFVVGWWSPRLVIPKHIVDRSSTDDMRLIIAHELNHLRRWDTATNWIQLGIQALWWFHPLVWWLNAEIRRWRESCCDEEVVARLQCQPAHYANCLLNVLELQSALRATSGLDGLSPFEVTKQRLQNIMQPLGQFPRSTPVAVWLAFIGLTLIVLPGAAFTIPPQEVLAHDEIPTAPLIAIEPSVPPAPPLTTPILPTPTVPATVPVVALDSLWKYKFDVHRAYQYQVSIESDGLRGTTRHTGQPAVRATYVSGGFWLLNISNPELTAFEAPDPSQPFGLGFRPPRIPGPFERGYEVTIDAQGRATEEVGDSSLPLFLGRWSNWLFCPLPAADRQPTWEEDGATSLILRSESNTEPFGFPRRGPFAQPAESSRLPASTHEQSTQSAAEGVLTLERNRSVKTLDLVDDEPRIELRQNSTWKFDAQLGVPVSLTGTGELIERRTNQSTTTPFKFTVNLSNPEEVAAPSAAAKSDSGPPPTSSPVPPQKKIEKGQKFLVEWNGSWFPGEVLDVPRPSAVKIRYSGYSDHWDEVVPRQRLREPAEPMSIE